MAKSLIALAYIQTNMGFTRYSPGDALPAEHPDAAAWVESGAALWRDEDSTPQGRAIAKRAAAEPGLPGIAVGGEATEEDLVGKVPISERRRRAWKR